MKQLFSVDGTTYQLKVSDDLVTISENDQEIGSKEVITGLTHDEAFDWLARKLMLYGNAFIPVTRIE